VSQQTLRIFLHELKTARVICQYKIGAAPCGTIVEVPISDLAKLTTCPTCGHGFQGDRSTDRYLDDLASAIKKTLANPERAKVEFLIDEPGNP
jgi:hypothetical protein